MSLCPSLEKLTELLADALSTAERDALALHVEECALCQEQLAHLTETFDAKTWRRAEHPHQDSQAEEAMMRRLKRMRLALAPTVQEPAARPTGPLSHAVTPMPVAVG